MDIPALLEARGITYESKGADEIAIVCPNQGAHSDGMDALPSFQINTIKEVGHCFACGYSLNQIGMTKWLIGDELDEMQLEAMTIKAKLKRLQAATEDDYVPTGEGYLIMPPGRPYTEEYRGIMPETYETLEAIKCTVGRYQNRICFPITQHGAFLGVDARTLGDDRPKYLRPSKSNAKAWLYPFDLAKERKIKRAILCEGIFHAINYLDKMGSPEALCYFGSNNWSEHKLLLLLEMNLNEVIFWPDNDAAGIKAMNDICPALAPWLSTYFIPPEVLPEKLDLGDFSTEDIEALLTHKRRWK